MNDGHTTTTETVPGRETPPHSTPSVVNVSLPLAGLTWLTFALVAVILYKLAWKPILTALDAREKMVRDAQEDARRVRDELAAVEKRRQDILNEAQTQSRRIVDEARNSALQLAGTIEARARQETRTMLEHAQREIIAATDSARHELRAETASLAVSLATRVLGETMDPAKHRAFVDKMTKELEK